MQEKTNAKLSSSGPKVLSISMTEDEAWCVLSRLVTLIRYSGGQINFEIQYSPIEAEDGPDFAKEFYRKTMEQDVLKRISRMLYNHSAINLEGCEKLAKLILQEINK